MLEPSLTSALRALAEQDAIAQATDAVREAATELRWHEALRRRWREARAEASVREAVAGASCEGAVVAPSVLREAVAAGALGQTTSSDPALDVAAGLWRAHTRLAAMMPPLRGRAEGAIPATPALLASLHRDMMTPLVAGGQIPLEEVGILRHSGALPRDTTPGGTLTGKDLAARSAAILELIDTPSLHALVRCAIVHAEIACVQPFTAANAALGRALVRHLTVRDGLEPTGVAVTSYYAGEAPGAYARALSAYTSGTGEGVTQWILWQAEALLAGIDEGKRLCRTIQAGSSEQHAAPTGTGPASSQRPL